MPDAKIIITADSDQVDSALQKLNTVVADSMGQIQGHFNGLAAAFGKINTVIAVAASALAGGKVFKESVDTVKDMTLEAVQLSKALGITAEEANVLNTALGNVFLDKDTYVDAVNKITKQLNSNSEAFERLGIKTRDAQGHLLPMQTIISNTVSRLMEFKAGADRNVMSNQLLGKSWEDVLKIAKLTPQVMQDAAKEVDDYQKTLDPQMVQQYREAIENAGDVFEGLKVAIGTNAMPMLTRLGEWLSGEGPTIVAEFRRVISKLSVAVEQVGETIGRVVGAISSSLPDATDDFSLLGTIAETVAVLVTEACYFINVAVVAVQAVLRDLAAAFITAWQVIDTAVKVGGQAVGGTLDTIGGMLVTLGKVALRALKGDFTGAAEAWDTGLKGIEEKVAQRTQKIAQLAANAGNAIGEAWKYSGVMTFSGDLAKVEADYNAAIAKIFSKKPAKPSGAAGSGDQGGDESGFDVGNKGGTRVSGWENQLEAQKSAFAKQQDEAGTFYEFSKQKEADYWASIKARHDLSKEERLAVEKKYYAVNAEIRKAAFEAQIATYKTEIEAANQNMQAKIAVAEKMAAAIKQKYGEESKEYQEAQRQIVQIKRQAAEQIRQLTELQSQAESSAALAGVDQAEAQAQLAVTLGKKTQAQMLADERAFEQQRYEIRQQALKEKLAQYQDDPVKYQQVLNEIAALDERYAIKRTQLQNKQAAQDMKYWNSLESGMSSMFESGMNKILASQLKFKDALKQVWGEIGKVFYQTMVVKPLAEWMAMQLKMIAMNAWAGAVKLAANLGFISAETAAKATGQATQTTTVVAGASTEIGAKGASAGAGAASAMSGIPIVGPVLAVAAMAAILASVLALRGKLKSASGGYDIPSGLNPVTQLHQEEMVLPAKYANVIRDMAGGSGAGQQQSAQAGHTVNYHDYSGTLSRDQIRKNAKIIADELAKVSKRGWSAG